MKKNISTTNWDFLKKNFYLDLDKDFIGVYNKFFSFFGSLTGTNFGDVNQLFSSCKEYYFPNSTQGFWTKNKSACDFQNQHKTTGFANTVISTLTNLTAGNSAYLEAKKDAPENIKTQIQESRLGENQLLREIIENVYTFGSTLVKLDQMGDINTITPLKPQNFRVLEKDGIIYGYEFASRVKTEDKKEFWNIEVRFLDNKTLKMKKLFFGLQFDEKVTWINHGFLYRYFNNTFYSDKIAQKEIYEVDTNFDNLQAELISLGKSTNLWTNSNYWSSYYQGEPVLYKCIGLLEDLDQTYSLANLALLNTKPIRDWNISKEEAKDAVISNQSEFINDGNQLAPYSVYAPEINIRKYHEHTDYIALQIYKMVGLSQNALGVLPAGVDGKDLFDRREEMSLRVRDERVNILEPQIQEIFNLWINNIHPNWVGNYDLKWLKFESSTMTEKAIIVRELSMLGLPKSNIIDYIFRNSKDFTDEELELMKKESSENEEVSFE